jgi:hypothetical protein
MADTSLFARLRRLFSTNVIVRNVGGQKLKVADTSRTQSIYKNNLVDRYQKIFTGAGLSGYSDALLSKSVRLNLFKDYEAMDTDAIISSALDIYSDESTMKSEYGEVLQINSDNNQIKEILHNLFYDILNIEFNLWPWIRNMCKYGDFFLKLEIDEKYGITNVVPLSVYDVARIEGLDPENPEYVKFLIESATSEHRFKSEKSSTKVELENYEVAHFRLLSDSNYLPYGKSQVEGARKIYKQLTLMEDAMLIHRIMRAPEKRIFKLDIGNIPPAEVDNYMQQVINKMKKAPVVDENTGDYNLKYNMQNITEDFFLPVRGGDSGTNIESLPGLTYEATEDIEYLKNKMLSALRIPKAFLGFEENVGSKATLAAEDVRFARTIERIQRIAVSELTKIAIVHLYAQGYQDSDLINFRRQQIENEGNDPAKTGEAQGTPSDMAMGRTGHELDDKGGAPEGGFEGAGRPKEIPKYGKDFSARGRDPLGNVDRKNATKPGQTLALAHFDKLKKSMNMNKGNIKVLNETNELESEYKSELNVIGEDTSDE